MVELFYSGKIVKMCKSTITPLNSIILIIYFFKNNQNCIGLVSSLCQKLGNIKKLLRKVATPSSLFCLTYTATVWNYNKEVHYFCKEAKLSVECPRFAIYVTCTSSVTSSNKLGLWTLLFTFFTDGLEMTISLLSCGVGQCFPNFLVSRTGRNFPTAG